MNQRNTFVSLTGTICLAALLALTGCSTTPDGPKAEKPVFPSPPDAPRFHYQQTIQSSADVEPEDENAAFKRFVTGQSRSGIGIAKPFGVTVHKGRVFVSDTAKRMVAAFDKVEHKFIEIGTSSPGELRKPMGLDVDRAGTLYVCDASAKEVIVYNRDGTYLRTLGSPDLFSRPAGLTVNPEGTRVFVVDTGGVSSDKHRVVVLDALTGEFLYNISRRGKEAGELNLPRDATIGADGNLYIVDGGNFRVQVFNQQGDFIFTFGDIGRRGGQFSRPKGIGTDSDGNIYVADAAFGNFQIFNSQGQLLLSVGRRGSQGDAANFMLPAGLAVDEDNRVYMVDQFFKKIDVFRPTALGENEGYFSLGNSPAED